MMAVPGVFFGLALFRLTALGDLVLAESSP